MLQLTIKIIISITMAICSFIIIRNLLSVKQKLLSFYTIINIIVISTPVILLYRAEYSAFTNFFYFIVSILVFKNMFKISFRRSVIVNSLSTALIAFGDIIVSTIEMPIFTYDQMRNIWYIVLLNNFLVCLLAILISKNHWLQDKLKTFCTQIDKDSKVSSVVFAILFVLIIGILYYNMCSMFNLTLPYMITIITLLVFFVLYYFYMEEKKELDKLSTQYNYLFDYVQEFENWIDDEQLYRHELKNNLSMIRSLTKNKKIIDKIDDMLHFSIIVDESYIEDLKNIPKGGLKGLLYYKLAISKNANVKTVVEVSPKCPAKIKKLSKDNLKQLGILLGIYLDNAIEAAKDSKKRLVTLEVYTLKDEINFVISNTFKEPVKIKDLNKKGYTTKGDGHGKGLYYAQKTINKNKNFSSSQMILNDFFVQKLSIK